MRKILYVLTLCIIISLIGLVGGCKNSDPANPDDGGSVLLGQVNVDLYGDSVLASENASLWSTENSAIVSVDSNGKIIGLAVGSAKVYTNSDKTEYYNVSVQDKGKRPNLIASDISVAVGAENIIETQLFFDSKYYNDYTVSFSTANTDIITLNQVTGEFEANKAGEATITVTASWRNVPSVFLTKEVKVKSVFTPDTSIYTDYNSVNLYTVANVGEQQFKNTQDVSVYVIDEGEYINVTNNVLNYEIENGKDDLIDITQDGDKFTIVGKKEGDLKVYFTYSKGSSAEEQFTVSVDVSVSLAKVVLSGEYYADKINKTPQEISNIINDFTSIVDITDASNHKVIYDNNSYNNSAFSVGKRTWLVSNSKYAVQAQVNFVSAYITTEEQFLNLFSYLDITSKSYTDTYASSSQSATATLITYDGYIVIDADLDFTNMPTSQYKAWSWSVNDDVRGFGWMGYTPSEFNAKEVWDYMWIDRNINSFAETGFIGTIDGRGHTIKGLRIGYYGMFSSIGTNGVIKDLAFADTVLANQSYGIAGHMYGTIDNVLMDIKSHTSNNSAGIAGRFAGKLTNSIVHFPSLPVSSGGGIICVTRGGANISGTHTIGSGNVYGLEGANYNDLANFHKDIESYNALSKDYSGFSDSWDLTGYELPVFKTYTGINIPKKETSTVAGIAAIEKALAEAKIKIDGVQTVSEVKVGNQSLDFEYDDGYITINRITANSLPYGEQTVKAQTNNGLVSIDVLVVDKVITTTAEFLNMFDYLKITDNGNYMLTYDGYIVLGTNLDFSGMAAENYVKPNAYTYDSMGLHGFGWVGYSPINNMTANESAPYFADVLDRSYQSLGGGFQGVFDGMGHTVKGLRVGPYGFFPAVGTNGVIKNVAFADTTLGSTGYMFGYGMFGTVDNVLVDIIAEAGSASTGICSEFNGTLKNSIIHYPCITRIDSGDNSAGIARDDWNEGSVKNTYVIGNADGKTFGDETSAKPYYYTSVSAFASSSHNYSGFDTSIWDFDSYKIPVFKTYNGTNVARK